MNHRTGMSHVSLLLALAMICAAAVWGQVTTATIYGTVTDATGGVIPGATVTLTHTSTGTTSVTAASGSGDFQFDFLRVGSYSMTVRATGFKGFESKMDLTAGQSVRRSYALEVGAATETIQVESAAPLVNTVSAEQLQTFYRRRVIDLHSGAPQRIRPVPDRKRGGNSRGSAVRRSAHERCGHDRHVVLGGRHRGQRESGAEQSQDPPGRQQRPNPNLAVSYYADQSQTLSYTSWQTSLRKRYSHNLSGSFHYTWGKSLSTGGGSDPGAYFHEGGVTSVQDLFNVKADRGPSLGDITHYAAAEMIYELPRLTNMNPFVRQAFGGWRVASIYVGQTGQPLNITQSSALNVNRPDHIGGPAVLDNYNATRLYLNPAAFAKVPIVAASRATARPGTIGSGAVRAPGAWNFDFSLAKDFHFPEKIKLQLRTDMFNALNHVNLTGLVTGIDSATFGQLRSNQGAAADSN